MTWMVIGGLILVAVVGTLFIPWRPESLQERVARVAKAAVQGDLQTIRELAVTGTASEPSVVRRHPAPVRRAVEAIGLKQLAVETEIKQRFRRNGPNWSPGCTPRKDLERRGKALPDATITAAPASEPISLPMFWRSEGWRGDGGWTASVRWSCQGTALTTRTFANAPLRPRQGWLEVTF